MDPNPAPDPDPDPDPAPFFNDFKILFVKNYFTSLKTFMGNGKDPDPDPYSD
jgi:hypothetical protein